MSPWRKMILLSSGFFLITACASRGKKPAPSAPAPIATAPPTGAPNGSSLTGTAPTPPTAPSARATAPATIRVERFRSSDPWPVLGVTLADQKIRLGGLSGLVYLGTQDGRWQFMTLTDRGPNADLRDGKRPFLLPAFHPEWVLISAAPGERKFRLEDRIVLNRGEEQYFTGIPTQLQEEPAVDVEGNPLPADPNGIDPEALARTEEGHYWVGEEYGPSLMKFDPQGKLLSRLGPGKGLPEKYSQRRTNRGFEGLAVQDGKVYGFLQSPLADEGLKGRIIEIDEKTQKVLAEYFYPFDSATSDKIGDVAGLGKGRFLVLERDSATGPTSAKRIYRIQLGKPGELVRKELIADLASLGYPYEQAEGLTVIDENTLAVLNDNNFGLNGVPRKSGVVPLKSEVPELWILKMSATK